MQHGSSSNRRICSVAVAPGWSRLGAIATTAARNAGVQRMAASSDFGAAH